MIISDSFIQTVVPVVHDIPLIDTIYILVENGAQHEDLTKEWSKINGVFTDIDSICKSLQQPAYVDDKNLVTISSVSTNSESHRQNSDRLDPSFMYTQILKEILLTIDFEEKHFNQFISYCRELYQGDSIRLKTIDKLEQEYHLHDPIWWYTSDSFLYSMLGQSLRTMEVNLIIKMGFFIRDLHNSISKLYAQQFSENSSSNSLTVYRGQGMSQANFDQMFKIQGGLLSFNNFLSTSLDREISFFFADASHSNPDIIGVLFEITINPSASSVPFAKISDVKYFEEGEEILFSTHSKFRIESIKQIDGNNRLWQVNLMLTDDNDPEIHALTEYMREEIYSEAQGWDRLGLLLIKLGKFDKAQEVYDILLGETTTDQEKALMYHRLGMIKNSQGRYTDAITYFQQSIEIKKKVLSPTDSDLASSYDNIGLVYKNMGDYSNALSFHQNALEIRQKNLPANHHDLATSYNNIGLVYNHMSDYSNALSFHQKALEIRQKTLPSNHPDLASSYNNMGSVYENMGNYSNALVLHQKALEIREKTLPSNHPSLAASYGHVGIALSEIGDHSKAILHCERALKMVEDSLQANHPHIQFYRDNLEYVIQVDRHAYRPKFNQNHLDEDDNDDDDSTSKFENLLEKSITGESISSDESFSLNIDDSLTIQSSTSKIRKQKITSDNNQKQSTKKRRRITSTEAAPVRKRRRTKDIDEVNEGEKKVLKQKQTAKKTNLFDIKFHIKSAT
ncbi:unnamed protein product [Rotaria sp. Silwood1]|nr:unnamed protein product [Rotaria sp. Silwood1]CAF1656952.1 unnamed protein product [Rotaria sp. Silwood1]